MKKYILQIDGPSCSGKSTTAIFLMRKLSNVFHISSDKIKRLITGYKPITYRDVVSRLVKKLAENAVIEGFSLLVEEHIELMKSNEQFYKKLAEDNGYEYLHVGMSAPLPVLLERFNKILEADLGKGFNPGLQDTSRLVAHYEQFINDINDTMILLDSSEQSEQQLVEQIIQRLPVSHNS